MEDEIVIGNTLLLIGIFIIFIGFLMIIIGVALGIFQDSKSEQNYYKRDYHGRMEQGSTRQRDSFGQTSESWRSTSGQPPAEKVEPKVKAGGVIMLGPIPIIFGSDKESAKTAIILAIILMLLSLLFLKGWLF